MACLDVVAHEITHAFTEHTAGLIYSYESGALNESFADIFGAMMDREDWFIGEDIAQSNVFPTGRMGDMSNPNNGGNQLGDNGWQPDHVNEQYFGSQDNGGVHINSGIINHAYYLFAETSGVGKGRAEQVFYRALTFYLTKSSNFKDCRAAVEKAAEDLYNNSVKQAASNAFSSVGINDGGGQTDYENDVEMNPGEDFLLHSDFNLSEMLLRNNSLELIADPLNNVNHISKPSVTDDGTAIYFVGSDNNIYVSNIDWNAGTVNTNVLDDQGIWRSVSVSKDGTKLAALTDDFVDEILILALFLTVKSA